MENLELAKKYILKALDIDKSYGLAYIKMATIYSQAQPVVQSKEI